MENGKNIKIFPSEYRFCQILWENEPATTTQLVYQCRDKLNWTKSTTYTVIRRLVSRGLIKKEGTLCSSLASKTDVQCDVLTELIAEYFEDYSEFIQVIQQIQSQKIQSQTFNAEPLQFGGYTVTTTPQEPLWIRCPFCEGKTRTKVYADTVLANFPLFCPKCKKEVRIDVAKLKMAISK